MKSILEQVLGHLLWSPWVTCYMAVTVMYLGYLDIFFNRLPEIHLLQPFRLAEIGGGVGEWI